MMAEMIHVRIDKFLRKHEGEWYTAAELAFELNTYNKKISYNIRGMPQVIHKESVSGAFLYSIPKVKT